MILLLIFNCFSEEVKGLRKNIALKSEEGI